MQIGVIGAGYVGLVTGVCLAEMGNHVTVVDVIPEKIAALREGKCPIYEPGLEELLSRNLNKKRLSFSTNIADAVSDTQAIFLAVGTPMSEDGSADLQYIEGAARDVAKAMDGHRVIIVKSTVPVGTNRRLCELLDSQTSHEFDLVSNPEFLKEGAAIDDFLKPDRVVIGARSDRAIEVMQKVYEPFVRTGHPIMVVDPESAEMIKYVSNALLASRISFMNEMSRICSAVGADIDLVRKGVGADRRIGQAFLFPGLGYGGSCFPKDVRALEMIAKNLGIEADLCKAIDVVNQRQREIVFPWFKAEFGADLSNLKVALWGLAFKPRTDDVREAPALAIAEWLVAAGAQVTAFDPVAMQTTRHELGDSIQYAEEQYDALQDADLLLIATEWNEFRSPDFAAVRERLRQPLIFDGRNLYDLPMIAAEGFTYYSVGRPVVRQG